MGDDIMNLEISAAYDPINLIYTVTVGKNSVEIPGHTLTQKHVEELAKMLEGINWSLNKVIQINEIMIMGQCIPRQKWKRLQVTGWE